jgi:hypothetical protein
MKAYVGVEVKVHIPNLDTRLRWVKSFILQPLYTQYSVDERVHGFQIHPGHGRCEKYLHLPKRI